MAKEKICLNSTVFSPSKLFVVTWLLAVGAAYIGPANIVYKRYNVVPVTFTVEGLLWIGSATVAFLAGALIANRTLLTIRSPLGTVKERLDAINWTKSDFWTLRAALVAIYVFAIVILLLLIFWTGLAIREVGGLESFVSLTYQNWHKVRRLWPAQKPFTGGRLLYTGLISVVIFSASGLALLKQQRKLNTDNELRHRRFRRLFLILLLLGLVPLMVLPILVSQRLLLATALIGATISYLMVSPQGIPIRYPSIGVFLGFSVWTTQEVVRIGFSSGGLTASLRYSVNKALFYFTNDVGNLNRGVAFVSERSYGFESFQFVFRYLFIEKTIQDQFLQSFYTGIKPYGAGGTFTALGIPYLDFGIAGLLLIFFWGYVAQGAYVKAHQSVFAAQIYGLLAASIVLSWHAAIWSNPFFWFNIGVLSLLVNLVPIIRLKMVDEKASKSRGGLEG